MPPEIQMTDDTIIDKVRKLLRLSKSANEHEAKLALEHALRLASRHKIDVAALELDPEIEKIIHERFRVGRNLSYITKLVLNVVVAFFHVEIVVDRPEAVFVGTVTDVAIAYYVLGYLSQACANALREFEGKGSRKRRPSVSRRQNYIAGFIWGVRHRLSAARASMELEDSKFALVLATGRDRRKAYADRLMPNTREEAGTKPRRNWSAAMEGWQRGKDTVIRTPLEGGKTTLLL